MNPAAAALAVPKRLRCSAYPHSPPPPAAAAAAALWPASRALPAPPSAPLSAHTVPSWSPLPHDKRHRALAAVSLSLAAIDASLGVSFAPSAAALRNAVQTADIDLAGSFVSCHRRAPPPPPPSAVASVLPPHPFLLALTPPPPPPPTTTPAPRIEAELHAAVTAARRARAARLEEIDIDRALQGASRASSRIASASDARSASSAVSGSGCGGADPREENSCARADQGEGCVLERLRMVEKQIGDENDTGSSTTVMSPPPPPSRRVRKGRVTKKKRARAVRAGCRV